VNMHPGLAERPAIPDEYAASGRRDVPEDERGIAVLDASAAAGPVGGALGLTFGTLDQTRFRRPGGRGGPGLMRPG
jgi:hypothetical protein